MILEEALDLVTRQRSGDALARVTAAGGEGGAPIALSAFLSVLEGDFDGAVEHGRKARDLAEGVTETALAGAASAFVAAAVGEEAAGYDASGLPGLVLGVPVEDRVTAFVRYLAVEASLACARLDLAVELIPERSPHLLWSGHPYGPVMAVCRARSAAFAARIDEAAAALDAYDDSTPGLGGALMRATRTLIAGNAGDREALAERIEATLTLVAEVPITPTDYIGRGIHLLVSYGVVALGDKTGAAHALLRAGGDACLSHLILVDRAIGIEMLTAAALEVEDIEAARGWLEQGQPLLDLRAARPSILRAAARFALVEGRADDALAHAREAGHLATAEARGIEAFEAGILTSRALIALGESAEAAGVLRAVVEEGDANGFGAVRQSASRTLRVAGRRLPPVLGGGWEALSPREREVADLLLTGAEPDEVAADLVLSPATVRVHTSRVLAAFGVASRIGLLCAVRPTPSHPRDLPQLTPRQHEVAALIAMDHSNVAIAEDLGVSVKAVESHVGEIRRRLGVESRLGVARTWWDHQG